jgi:glutamate N-acetyltransferase/amino-acid N-acetyltransferase
MESYTRESDYLEALEARSGLPEGFQSATTTIRFFPAERNLDTPLSMNLSLILLERETESFGAVFTSNRFAGAPVLIGRNRIQERATRGVLINNKISNVCSPGAGENAEKLLSGLGTLLGVSGRSFFTASTGIIGWRLPLREMEEALPSLVKGVGPGSILPVARAIMTTDSFPKVRKAAVGRGSIVGIAKGAGMIEPNLATLLCFICTDVEVEREKLREDLAWCVQRSLNRISVDGDQSTSDMALLFSSGRRGKADPVVFRRALLSVLTALSEDIVRNAEGAGHVMRVRVVGAADQMIAAGAAKAVVNSPLVKTAVFGNDPNVGRIVSALGDYFGNNGISLDTAAVVIRMGGIDIFSNGAFRLDSGKEEALSSYLRQAGFDPAIKGYPRHDRIVEIEILLNGGSPHTVEMLGTDLSHQYVSENADYRS